MVFKKKKKHPQIADKSRVRIIFTKLAEQSLSFKIKLGNEQIRSRPIQVEDDALFSTFRREDIERFGIKANQNLQVIFYHEGKEHYGSMKVLGAGRFSQQEAIRFEMPSLLAIKDDFGLTTFNVSPRLELTFTNMFKGYCSGQLVNIGENGVDFINKETSPTKELITVDRECDVAFDLDNIKVYNKGHILYINNVGEELVGVEFQNMDNKTKSAITQWITDKANEKIARDKAWLKSVQAGTHKRGATNETGTATPKGPRLIDDYHTLLHEGSPNILILSRDKSFLARAGKTLMRKYGVLVSKGRFSNVREILQFYDVSLILSSDTLGTISGYDLVNTMQEQLDEVPPIILMGTGDENANREKALIACNALDYWDIETFRPLSFFKSVEEVLSKIAEENGTTEGDTNTTQASQDEPQETQTSKEEP